MNDALIHEIVALFHGGASMRRIARSLRISRRTVRQALEPGRAGPRRSVRRRSMPRRQPRRGSQLDAYEPAIADLLARYPDITAQRIYEELRRLGYQGSYTILSQRVRSCVPRPVVRAGAAVRDRPGRAGTDGLLHLRPGLHDEGRRRVHAFSYVLGYSRRQYLHFVEAQDFATTVREHIRAFEHLGGVAATCLYDNMKVVVSGYDGDEPVYNPRFLAFAAHYGFRPVACRARRPQTKGKGRAALRICRIQLAGRPDLPLPGAPERDGGLVAGRGRRRARPSPDQGAARSIATPRSGPT